MSWVAVVIVVGQGATIGALLLLVRTFGAYTNALEAAHKSNMIVYQQSLKLIQHAEDLYNKESAA